MIYYHYYYSYFARETEKHSKSTFLRRKTMARVRKTTRFIIEFY